MDNGAFKAAGVCWDLGGLYTSPDDAQIEIETIEMHGRFQIDESKGRHAVIGVAARAGIVLQIALRRILVSQIGRQIEQRRNRITQRRIGPPFRHTREAIALKLRIERIVRNLRVDPRNVGVQ